MGSSACGCISGSRAQWLIRSKYSILICVQQLHTVSHSVILENGGAVAENSGSLPENGGSIPENGWFSSGERGSLSENGGSLENAGSLPENGGALPEIFSEQRRFWNSGSGDLSDDVL